MTKQDPSLSNNAVMYAPRQEDRKGVVLNLTQSMDGTHRTASARATGDNLSQILLAEVFEMDNTCTRLRLHRQSGYVDLGKTVHYY